MRKTLTSRITMSQYAVSMFRIVLATLLIVLGCATASAQTVMPAPFQTALDNSGLIINNACIWTYTAGTTTAVTTYTDKALSVANTNPIRSDSAGRFVAYLTVGVSYKFTYESSCTPPAHGTVLKTVDNINAVPTSSANLDVTGTAGEAITAGNAVYLSDGSGAKTAGSWYKADSANAYSSLTPVVGMAPASIASSASGSVRIAGQMTGLTVTAGSSYYIGTAGAITTTAPVQARLLGQADSTSTLILPNPLVPVQPWVDDFRLTLTTALPVTTADVTAAGTIYLTPMTGNRIDLPDANGNPVRVTSAELSIAVPAATSQMYDVFVYNAAGVATLELLAWTNDTTRATAIIRTTTGRYYKTGDLTRMFIGVCRTTTVANQTEDSFAKRYLWNFYNRVPRIGRVLEATATWAYTTATYRQANGSTANQVDFVIGVADVVLDVTVNAIYTNTSIITASNSIGVDGTTAAANVLVLSTSATVNGAQTPNSAKLTVYPAVGRHFYTWLEQSQAVGATTWYGNNGDATKTQSGIVGMLSGG